MSTWYSMPSKRPRAEAQACIDRWRAQGYKVAVWRDTGDDRVTCEILKVGQYPGYAQAQNRLIAQILLDPSADWIVCGGDDTDPDPNHTAEEIALQCWGHFRVEHKCDAMETFGVMQPTGDRFANGSIDRIAGSPWIGREFALRVNGGRGPYWPEYWHMFVDEEIMEVAQLLGVFWQRPDLIHLHHHFMRKSDAIDSPAVSKPIPAHLREANSPEHWRKYQTIFRTRKAAGFPGHEPLPVGVCA